MRRESRRDAIAPLTPLRGEGLGVRGCSQFNQRIHCSTPREVAMLRSIFPLIRGSGSSQGFHYTGIGQLVKTGKGITENASLAANTCIA